MRKKLAAIFCLLVSSSAAFSQSGNADQRPQAYLVSSGDARPAISRPRVVKILTTVEKQAKNSKSKCDYSLERQVFELINKQRQQLGLADLEWNEDIAKMAREHSENMADFKYFSHTDLNGLIVSDRADASGIKKWRAIGENIAYNRGYENPATSAVERWMQSPAHRENLLSNRWKESGIGIAVTEDGTYYFTEVFLRK